MRFVIGMFAGVSLGALLQINAFFHDCEKGKKWNIGGLVYVCV
jgi:hypothetical protein